MSKKSNDILLKYLSTKGYKKDSPDKNRPVNVIPSNKITMKDVDFPVEGVDNLGNRKVMIPGEDYTFPGDYVVETPANMSCGGSKRKHQTGGELGDNEALYPDFLEGDYKKQMDHFAKYYSEKVAAYNRAKAQDNPDKRVIEKLSREVTRSWDAYKNAEAQLNTTNKKALSNVATGNIPEFQSGGDIDEDDQYARFKQFMRQDDDSFENMEFNEPKQPTSYNEYEEYFKSITDPLYKYKQLKQESDDAASSTDVENTEFTENELKEYEKFFVKNLKDNKFNRAMKGVNKLGDPKSLAHFLPNTGAFGTLKAFAGAAAGLSGATRGYQKLFSPEKEKAQYGMEVGNNQMEYSDWLKEMGLGAMGSEMEDYQEYKDYLADAQPFETKLESFNDTSAVEDDAKNMRNLKSFKMDPQGTEEAFNSISGLAMVNDVLEAKDFEKRYKERMREIGNTMNRYNTINPKNPFGHYTPNTGVGTNFSPVTTGSIQNFGTGMIMAKNGGYIEGTEYYLSEEDVNDILRRGGEIEFID